MFAQKHAKMKAARSLTRRVRGRQESVYGDGGERGGLVIHVDSDEGIERERGVLSQREGNLFEDEWF